MREEKIIILQMLEEGKITAEDAINLLQALDEADDKTKFTNKTLEEIGSDIGNAFANLFTSIKDMDYSMGINNLIETIELDLEKLARRGKMSQETLQILYMVRDGKISPEEGERLLNALDVSERKVRDNKAEFIKIKVSDQNDSDKVNVTLPISLLSTGIKLAEKFSPEFRASGLTKSDIDDILLAVKSGEKGKIIDLEKDSGERVEITIT